MGPLVGGRASPPGGGRATARCAALRSRSRVAASPPFGAVSLTRHSGARRRPARGTKGRRPTVPLLHAAYSTAGPPRIAWPQAATHPAQPSRGHAIERAG